MEEYYEETLRELTTISASALSRCEGSGPSIRNCERRFETICHLFEERNKKRLDQWFNELTRLVLEKTNDRVRLERLAPGEPGHGGTKGRCIYAKLVRFGHPDLPLTIGPYDPAIKIKPQD